MIAFMQALITIICFIAAGVLAYYDKDGWGWMIFAGIICCPSDLVNIKITDTDTKQSEIICPHCNKPILPTSVENNDTEVQNDKE